MELKMTNEENSILIRFGVITMLLVTYLCIKLSNNNFANLLSVKNIILVCLVLGACIFTTVLIFNSKLRYLVIKHDSIIRLISMFYGLIVIVL